MPGGHGAVVVLAENEAAQRQLCRRALQDAGFRVLAAADGVKALALAEAHSGPIDLLVSDERLPHLGGPDLAASLRTLHPGLRVLLLRDSHKAGDDLGGDALLTKPFPVADLVAKARELLGGAE
jgi:two-component system, cell cycle sensor histidine kinase and response regulator CckA